MLNKDFDMEFKHKFSQRCPVSDSMKEKSKSCYYQCEKGQMEPGGEKCRECWRAYVEKQEPGSGWISVNNRLPYKEDEYLIFPRKYENTAFYNTHGEYAGKWTIPDENGYDYEVIVTHWQLLPKSPEDI